ncbi:MAG: hypothetical protein R3E58_06170 [Phycisphaerae bacterium]
MTAMIHWKCLVCLVAFTVSDGAVVKWDANGLSCAELIRGIADCSGDAFAIRAAMDDADRSRRFYCSTDSITETQALTLAESLFGLSVWKVGRISIWMDRGEVPGLIAADIKRLQATGDSDGRANLSPDRREVGDVELADATLPESVRAITLAFGVPIVYSSESDVSTDGISVERLSLSLGDVDLNTCLSLVAERFEMRWSVVGEMMYLAPAGVRSGNASGLPGNADLRDGVESVTDFRTGQPKSDGRPANRRLVLQQSQTSSEVQTDRSVESQLEAERLCRELEVRD